MSYFSFFLLGILRSKSPNEAVPGGEDIKTEALSVNRQDGQTIPVIQDKNVL